MPKVINFPIGVEDFCCFSSVKLNGNLKKSRELKSKMREDDIFRMGFSKIFKVIFIVI